MTGRDTAGLETTIGHAFARPALARTALTHASAVGGARSNERLEFLGDRVLGLSVAELLFETFPGETEGELARRHAALVSRPALARVAGEIGLGDLLVLAPAEEESGGRDNPGILADCCEALIAALFLDGGWECARAFVRDRWAPLVAEDLSPPKDAKTALQEWAQARGRPLPGYREVARSGPAHAPRFTIEVSVEGLGSASGEGTSKREAERAAADSLLERARGGDDDR